ncbi:MBL fold metallo-hydrolase [Dermatophilaceae bacterium Soc4.6]
MDGGVIEIPMEHVVPAGALGPEPVRLEVRAHLSPHETGLVLVDTGMDPSGRDLDAALARSGASWSDVSHVVVTHAHPDHVGALDHVRRAAPAATVLAHPLEAVAEAQSLVDGQRVGRLRAVATPGHTAGHLSLLDEAGGVLLVGDCLGSVGAVLVRAPEQFTADARRAEQSLHLLRTFRGTRLLFSHGAELEDPWPSLDVLLDALPEV